MLPSLGAAEAVVLHELVAKEAEGFELEDLGVQELGPLPVSAAGVGLAQQGNLIEVTLLGDSRSTCGFPTRSHDQLVFRLSPGQWGRSIRNHRHSGWQNWSYAKTVVNVANLLEPDLLVFASGKPKWLLDEQVRLW